MVGERSVRYSTHAQQEGQETAVKKAIVVTFLKYGLGLGLLAWVIWQYWDSTPERPGLAEAFSPEKEINFVALTLAAATFLAGMLLTFYRWYVLVRAQGLPFTVAAGMRLGLIGFYLSTFLPGSVGGDIIKAAFLARQQSRRTVAVATVVVDRFVGLCGLIWLVALVGGVAWLGGLMARVGTDDSARAYLQMIVLIAIGLTAASFAVWFAAGFVSDQRAERVACGLQRIPKLGGSVAELWRALHMYRQRGASVALTLILSMVGHIGFVLAFYFAALTLTPEDQIPTLAAHFVIVPVGFPSPGGVGGSELGFGTLYKMIGFTIAAGVLGSLVLRVITWALGLLGYIVYLRMKPNLQPPGEVTAPLRETEPKVPAATSPSA
jgi:glycosyltransferase 2 family protein